MERESMTDTDGSSTQLMRGLLLAALPVVLAHAATPYLVGAPQTTVQYLALATLMVSAYGIYRRSRSSASGLDPEAVHTAFTAPMTLSGLERLRRSDRIPLE